jgi:hypothetical protein
MDWYDDEFTTTGPFGRPKPVREFENYFFIPIPLFVKYFLVDRLDDVSKYINFEKAKTLWKYQFKIYIDAHTGKTIPEYMVDKNDIYRPLKAQKYREKSIESTNEYLIL